MVAWPRRERNFTHIDVAMRVDRQPVRRHEFAWPMTGTGTAESRKKLAAIRHDAHSCTQIGRTHVHSETRTKFADVADLLAARRHAQSAWPMQIVPLSLVDAVAVENLHSVIFSIRHVDPPIKITTNIVHKIELSGVSPGLAP